MSDRYGATKRRLKRVKPRREIGETKQIQQETISRNAVYGVIIKDGGFN